MTRRKGVMSMALFGKILGELAQHRDELATVYLNVHGEPLIDPLVSSRIQRIAEHGLGPRIQIQTNGQYLNESTARALLDADIGQITLGFDGASKDVHEQHRAGCSYERVLDNVYRFLELRAGSPAATSLAIQYVRTAANEHEVEAAYAFWQRLLQPGRDWFFNTVSKAWATPRLDASPLILETTATTGAERVACPMLRESFNVLFDGRVPACCWDYDVAIVAGGLGDVGSATIADIWRGTQLDGLRRQHDRHDWRDLPRCATCTMTRRVDRPASSPGDATRFGVVREVEPLGT
jgi:MoaA/NifB/PqqE/SkfB family radical SAM enzyme